MGPKPEKIIVLPAHPGTRVPFSDTGNIANVRVAEGKHDVLNFRVDVLGITGVFVITIYRHVCTTRQKFITD